MYKTLKTVNIKWLCSCLDFYISHRSFMNLKWELKYIIFYSSKLVEFNYMFVCHRL